MPTPPADTPVTPAQQLRLDQEALALLARGLGAMGISSALAVPLAAWLLQGFIGPAWAWGTAALMLLATAERAWFLRRLRRADPAQIESPRRWARGIVGRCLLVGLLFNGWNHAAMQSPEFMAAIYMFSIALMVAANAMTQLCVWPAAVVAYISPLLLGLAWSLWSVGDVHSDGRLAGGVFLVVLWAMLLAATRRFAASMQREMRTRLLNEALLAEIDDKRRQAEAASAAKTRFLAAASHDLRQPVHAMTLLGETLREHLRGTPHAPLMGQMLAATGHFSRLVDEVMDLARADAPEAGAQMAAVPVRGLAARAEAAFRPGARARGLALWLRLPAGRAPQVRADAALLWRVLGNLLDNAVRYTEGGGVMLAVRRARLADGRPAWRLEVRDSGPGIAVHQREAVFEEFYRAHDPHRAGGEQGHGLGLAVARRMARLMGTEVRLHSAAGCGAGAVFSLTLEALPDAPSPAPAYAPSLDPPLPPLPGAARVLVVDDDPLARQALRGLLAGWGVRAQAAAGVRGAGVLARRAARQGVPIGVLVTDHWLAGGELSADVVAAVRPHAPRLRVAVVSGGAGGEVEAALRAQGIVFWRKPLRPATLHAWLGAD